MDTTKLERMEICGKILLLINNRKDEKCLRYDSVSLGYRYWVSVFLLHFFLISLQTKTTSRGNKFYTLSDVVFSLYKSNLSPEQYNSVVMNPEFAGDFACIIAVAERFKVQICIISSHEGEHFITEISPQVNNHSEFLLSKLFFRSSWRCSNSSLGFIL